MSRKSFVERGGFLLVYAVLMALLMALLIVIVAYAPEIDAFLERTLP